MKHNYQQEYLSYIDYINPDADPRWVVVTNLDTKYSPRFMAYCLRNGQTCPIKVRKNRQGGKNNTHLVNTFENTPFKNGDILYMKYCKEEPKAVLVDGKWTRDYSNKEWWLYEYSVNEKIKY